MSAKYFLVAEPQLTGFRLHKEGEHWEQDFHTIRQALRYVRSLPQHEGELIVLNATGKEISHISIEEPQEEDEWHAPASLGQTDRSRSRKHSAAGPSGRTRHRSRTRQRAAVPVETAKPRQFPWVRWLIIAAIVTVAVLILLAHLPKEFAATSFVPFLLGRGLPDSSP